VKPWGTANLRTTAVLAIHAPVIIQTRFLDLIKHGKHHNPLKVSPRCTATKCRGRSSRQ
jgi:hypothetical protein